VITRLICHFVLDFAVVEARWGIDFHDYFGTELARLEEMADDGLLAIEGDRIRVLPPGRLLIRNICMAFDSYLSSAVQQKSFSRVI
jgi:oxygen-independent coproporphyrinogen-3 oxidase